MGESPKREATSQVQPIGRYMKLILTQTVLRLLKPPRTRQTNPQIPRPHPRQNHGTTRIVATIPCENSKDTVVQSSAGSCAHRATPMASLFLSPLTTRRARSRPNGTTESGANKNNRSIVFSENKFRTEPATSPIHRSPPKIALRLIAILPRPLC